MSVLSKILVVAGAIKAASAQADHEQHLSVTTAVHNLGSIEIGQLLSTVCTPLTIYTDECHVVTIGTTNEPAPPAPTTTSEIVVVETTASVSSDVVESVITSSIEVETTPTDEVVEPTEDVTAGAGRLGLALPAAHFVFGIAAYLV